MFATLSGTWPRRRLTGVSVAELEAEVDAGRRPASDLEAELDALVAEVVAAQVEAGLEPISDGQVRWADLGLLVATSLGLAARAGERAAPSILDAWRTTAARTDRAVKQAMPGPYSLARRLNAGPGDRREITLRLADGLAPIIRALGAAGCPLVEVEEPAAASIGADPGERELFVEAQRRLLALAPEIHATLAISGGSGDRAGPAILADGYRSFLFDLIDGPDNWYLARAVPRDRGVIVGALRVDGTPHVDPGAGPRRTVFDAQVPLLVWAAHYAASLGGRGADRVGIANGSSLSALEPAAAVAAIRAIGTAARYAAMPLEEAVAEGLDPRIMDSRTAALGPQAATTRRRGRPASG